MGQAAGLPLARAIFLVRVLWGCYMVILGRGNEMGLQTFYLGDLPPSNWHEIFVFCLQYADSFSVRLLKSDDIKNEGFRALCSLPEVTITNWWGTKDGIEIRGPLTDEARNLLYELQEPAFYGECPELWDLKLFSQGREVLSIDDFTQRLIHLTDEEIDFLMAQDIDFSDWENIATAFAEGEAEEEEELEEEVLREIAGIISHWLSSDKKH